MTIRGAWRRVRDRLGVVGMHLGDVRGLVMRSLRDQPEVAELGFTTERADGPDVVAFEIETTDDEHFVVTIERTGHRPHCR